MVIDDLDLGWDATLRGVDAALREIAASRQLERRGTACWLVAGSQGEGTNEIWVEARNLVSDDPFDPAPPEPVLMVTRVVEALSKDSLSEEGMRATLRDSAEGLHMRACVRFHPDGSGRSVLAMTHTLYLASLDQPELLAVLGEASGAGRSDHDGA